jgi:general stress protein 26
MASADHTANLNRKEAIQKMQHIAGHGETSAMFCTFVSDDQGQRPMATRPMATQRVDDDGTFWFMSRRDSTKNRQIVANPTVQIIYAVGGSAEYMSLEGQATITRDQKKIDELWTPLAKTWFPQGKDDPELTLIAVKVTHGYYWDTKHSKMVALAGMALGAITGKETDDSIEGTLSV